MILVGGKWTPTTSGETLLACDGPGDQERALASDERSVELEPGNDGDKRAITRIKSKARKSL